MKLVSLVLGFINEVAVDCGDEEDEKASCSWA